MEAIVDVPKIEAVGNYKLNMRLGVLNLIGNGNMKAYLGKMIL